MTQAAVVLAAGAGRRYGRPGEKLLATVGGEPLVVRAVTAAHRAGLDETVVVVGAAGEAVADALVAALGPKLTILDNPNWADGLATSLRAAVDHATAMGHDAVVVGLGDQPAVPVAAWTAIAAGTGPVTVASFDGRPRPPVRLAATVWDELPSTGDEGARVLWRTRPDLVRTVPVAGDPGDVDTPDDRSRFEA